MTVGTQPPLGRIGLATRLARVAGFDVAWTIDHFQGFFPQAIWDEEFSFLAGPGSSPHAYFDYQALMGHLATRVGKMQVAVGVTEPIRRHPVLLAQTAMTIAHLSKRAPILGIGAGEAENITPYGLDFSRPVSQLAEALEIIRLCFASQGPFDYAGEFYRLSGALMDLRPPAGRTPELWIAAHGPRMLRLAGRFGDGWYPTLPYTPNEYAAALATVREAAAGAGRDPMAIVPGWQAVAVFGKTEDAARRLLESPPMRLSALLAPDYVWRRHGAAHPLGDGFRGFIDIIPQQLDRPALEAAMAAVPVDLVAETALWGTPDAIYSEVRGLVDAGLRHLVIQPISAMVSKRDALFSMRSVIRMQRRLKRDGV